jgi:hypothetical protein
MLFFYLMFFVIIIIIYFYFMNTLHKTSKNIFYWIIFSFIFVGCYKEKESTNNKLTVTKAFVSRDNSGQPTTPTENLLAEEQDFHYSIQLNKKQAGKKITVNLIAVAAEEYENYEVRSLEQVTEQDSILNFTFSLARPWFKGKYKCDVYVNDTLAYESNFMMQ